MTLSREDITAKIQETLADALGVDEEEVVEDATLMGDLGAESIDFLDIVFRLEKAFEIKIPREELFPGDNVLNNAELVDNGKVTPEGLKTLKTQLPHVDFSEFEKDPDLNKISDLFTVKSIIDYVASKVA
ncbi:MAG: acyl carrier protein [Sedimentisphaerales bacterium]|nr:acyl carrier protein [Sedimentisphaerales bacterium]